MNKSYLVWIIILLLRSPLVFSESLNKEPVAFDVIKTRILEAKNCLACHSQNGGFGVESTAEAFAIPICRQVFNKAMPPTGNKIMTWPRRDCELLLKWCRNLSGQIVVPDEALNQCHLE